MQYIYYKTNPQNTDFGTGFCSFMQACPTPINLINVNGTMTITDRENKIKLTINDNVVSVPILIDENIRGRVPITIQEKQTQQQQQRSSGTLGIGLFGSDLGQTQTQQSPSIRIYTLSIGKLFKTSFIVQNREFGRVYSKSDGLGTNTNTGFGSDRGYPNVIEMNLSFGVEGDMHLVNTLPTNLPSQ